MVLWPPPNLENFLSLLWVLYNLYIRYVGGREGEIGVKWEGVSIISLYSCNRVEGEAVYTRVIESRERQFILV